MILGFVQLCYNSVRQPFANQGAVKIQNLNSERPALKIVRAVLRDSDVDPDDAVRYSLHRCYCKSEIKIEDDDEDETFNPESTLDELEIKEGDSVFIRKIDDRVDEMQEEQGSTPRRSSRKRKEADYNENSCSDDLSTSTVTSPATSRKRRSLSVPSSAPAALDEVSSNLENLPSTAASAARSISKLLGGDYWQSQSVSELGPIQTRSCPSLQGLLRLVKTSLEIPHSSKSDRKGLFNSDLVEALTRAYHQRVGSSMAKIGQWSFFDLRLCDYEQANELLKGKIEHGTWTKSESALSKPLQRFPLSDSGLFGYSLSAARFVCVLWNNDKWLDQAPLPGLSPISLKDHSKIPFLCQMAQLTRVKPGEATPDGFPSIVLRALQEAIRQRESMAKPLVGLAAAAGWAQKRDLSLALEILKEELGSVEAASSSSTSTDSGNSKKRRTGKELK